MFSLKLFNPLKKLSAQNILFQKTIFNFGRAKPKENFYTPFEVKDQKELSVYDDDLNMDNKYRTIRDQWQKALERKTRRRERIQEIKAARPEIKPDEQKLVIHQPLKGIQYPPKEDEIFAVVEILGFQYKVLQDDMLTVDWLKDYDINDQIVFDKVLAVGTTDYTAIGRPYVSTARVYATVEQQAQSEKVIGLHYRRRKNSKKSWGHRTMMTILRVDKVEHILDQNILSQAVSL